MNLEKIYHNINLVFDSYINEGIKPEHLLNYLNVNEENFDYMYNRLYRKLSLENIQFDSDTLKECLIDVIVDKVNLMKDLKNTKV